MDDCIVSIMICPLLVAVNSNISRLNINVNNYFILIKNKTTKNAKI